MLSESSSYVVCTLKGLEHRRSFPAGARSEDAGTNNVKDGKHHTAKPSICLRQSTTSRKQKVGQGDKAEHGWGKQSRKETSLARAALGKGWLLLLAAEF